MLDFHEISVEDKSRLQPLLRNEKNRDCEYTFGNVILWSEIYGTKVAYLDEAAIIRHERHGAGYLVPVGRYDLKAVVELMLEDARRCNKEDRFSILAADISDFEKIEKIFPGRFQYREERDYAEYIYLSENLRELQGKKYHNKRNHIARFIDNHPSFTFNVVDKDNIDRVKAMNDEWRNRYSDEANSGLN